MANLKETRNRITSIRSTMQITSAMKMVSAAKLKKATDAITQMRPYAEKLQEILENLTSGTKESSDGIYSAVRSEEKVLVVAVTSNRGLCGGFNSAITKECLSMVSGEYADKNLSFLCIGKKGGEFLANKGLNVARTEIEIFNDMSFENVANIAEQVMAEFVEGQYDKVILVYNQFRNAAVQDVQNEQFLPLVASESENLSSNSIDYIYEPNKEDIVTELVPKSLKTQFYKAILDSIAGEHGARMTAMHKATDNAKDLADKLTLQYNKARQAAITTEILEIVGGAEALNG
ncbi:MAG: ATP synthase F1 subunit gamma [Flavobacteriales bacterium]|nr:ATP synthase F1 subunit gamma [Flavobacteriales bacterium]